MKEEFLFTVVCKTLLLSISKNKIKLCLAFQVHKSANLHSSLIKTICLIHPRHPHQLRMSDTWFKQQIAPNEGASGCHPDEAQALQSFLNKTINAQEAAHAITQPILSSGDFENKLNRLWNLLQDALIELPATHIPSLINILLAIQDLPDPDLTSKSRESTPDEERSTWKDLPGFGHLWADLYKSMTWRDELYAELSSPLTLEERQKLRATHIRKNHVEARLAAANFGGGWLDWGYAAIADALELDNAVLDFDIPAAREWLAIVGKELYQGAKEGKESWVFSEKRDMGKEEEKMSLIRWDFWEERMRDCQERAEVIMDSGKAAGEEMRKLRGEGN